MHILDANALKSPRLSKCNFHYQNINSVRVGIGGKAGDNGHNTC